MAVSTIQEFYPVEPGKLDVSCSLSEGNMTVANSNTALGTDIAYSFVSQLNKGDQVIAAGVDSDGAIMVAKREQTDAQPIGEVITEPRFVDVPSTTAGTINAGSYVRRKATVRFYGRAIRVLNVYLAQSNNLAVNDSLAPCDQDNYENYFMESATLTSRIALKAVNASSSAASTSQIPVLEGFESGTTVDATE